MEAVLAELEKDAGAPSATVRQGHLALLKRWYYRPEVKREGEICFPDAEGRWPIKAMLRSVGRVAAKTCGRREAARERMASKIMQTKESLRQMLAPGRPLETGRVCEVARRDRGAAAKDWRELVECLWDDEPGVCSRAADVLERVTPGAATPGAAVEGCAAGADDGDHGEEGTLEPGAPDSAG